MLPVRIGLAKGFVPPLNAAARFAPFSILHVAEHKAGGLAFAQREFADGGAVMDFERRLGQKRQLEMAASKMKSPARMCRLMTRPRVVEGGTALASKPHASANDAHDPVDMVVRDIIGWVVGNRHEVDDFGRSVGTEKARNENIAVRH